MRKNYTRRLESLKERRLDRTLNRAILSESFDKFQIGDSVKYTLESMQPIDQAYNQNSKIAANKIQEHISNGLNKLNLSADFRLQGSMMTNTNIKLHSDIDLLVITGKYYSLLSPLVPTDPYQGEPVNDLAQLRNNSYQILKSIYDTVDNTGAKSIKVYPTEPKRKVDVVIADWLETSDYRKSLDEKYKGVDIYNMKKNTRTSDFPFLNAFYINEKDLSVNGGLKKLIRLLKTLKIDAEDDINLTSFEISCAMYDILPDLLTLPYNKQLLLLTIASKQLEKLITNSSYRENLLNPTQNEVVFGTMQSKVGELKKLKLELDELIQDIVEEQAMRYNTINETIEYK